MLTSVCMDCALKFMYRCLSQSVHQWELLETGNYITLEAVDINRLKITTVPQNYDNTLFIGAELELRPSLSPSFKNSKNFDK